MLFNLSIISECEKKEGWKAGFHTVCVCACVLSYPSCPGEILRWPLLIERALPLAANPAELCIFWRRVSAARARRMRLGPSAPRPRFKDPICSSSAAALWLHGVKHTSHGSLRRRNDTSTENPPQAFHPTGHKSEGLHFQNGTQALSSRPIYSEIMLFLSLGPFPYFTESQSITDKELGKKIERKIWSLNDNN